MDQRVGEKNKTYKASISICIPDIISFILSNLTPWNEKGDRDGGRLTFPHKLSPLDPLLDLPFVRQASIGYERFMQPWPKVGES
jgi:uncharacterized membrane protein YkgB